MDSNVHSLPDQTVEAKQKFIAQIMSSKSPVRSCEDVDETALTYAEIKALCAGNPLIAEKMNLDVDVARLRMLNSEYRTQHYKLEDDLLKRFPEQITATKERVSGIEKDLATYKEHGEKLNAVQQVLSGSAAIVSAPFAGMVINGVRHDKKETAAKALLESCKDTSDTIGKPIGEYMGFQMALRYDTFLNEFQLLLRGSMTYQTSLGSDGFGNITRINNTLALLPKKLEGAREQLEKLHTQQEQAKLELQKPFALADELAEKEARLAMLNTELNIVGEGYFDMAAKSGERGEATAVENEKPPDRDIPNADNHSRYQEAEKVYAKSARPSFLDKLEAYRKENEQPPASRKQSDRAI